MRQEEQGSGQATQLCAAEYVRMSTEHQQYSTQNQADKIREYAARRGIRIVRTYTDEGKSGLNIGGRNGLKRLIQDVESGYTDFQAILVYDVSRWGRFLWDQPLKAASPSRLGGFFVCQVMAFSLSRRVEMASISAPSASSCVSVR